MKESEEDISARAEEYVRKYIKGNVIDFSVEVEVVKSFIEGYKSCLAAQSQSVEGRMYTERDMIAFGVFLGSYQNLEIEEVLDIFNKESGISEKPNNHIELLEKKLIQ